MMIKTVKMVGVVGVFIAMLQWSSSTANAQSRVTWACSETMLQVPENSLITSAETDGFSGSLSYTTPDGESGVLDLSLNPAFSHLFPMVVLIDGQTNVVQEAGPFIVAVENGGRLEDLVGKQVKELKALKLECDYSPGIGWIENYGTQWQLKVKFSEQPSGNGGGHPTSEPAQIEGFIVQLGEAEIEIGKEGKFETLTVTPETKITLNGSDATLDDLQLGDKAAARFDPDTKEALEIKAER